MVVPSAGAATFEVGGGASMAKLQRPGVHIDEWAASTLSASTQRPQGTVLAWTEVKRAKAARRWWWRTYTSWCSSGECSHPVEALRSLRAVRRTPTDSATPWRVRVSADMTRDRAVVKAGIRWGSRWAITSPSRLVGHGPTDNVWLGGFIGITHTPDGHDWLSWNNDHEQIRISKANNGRRLAGTVVGRGDTAKVRNIDGRWVLLSLGRTADDDTVYPVNLKTATSIAALRRARPTTLAKMGNDNFLQLFGPDDGPVLAVWESTADVDRVNLAGNGVWVDRSGTLSASQILGDDALSSAFLRSTPTPSGGLSLCPGGLAGPLGGSLQPSPSEGSCLNAEVSPLRLKGG